MKHYPIRTLIILIILFAQIRSFSQSIDHWETLFRTGDSCRYLVPDREVGTEWHFENFDDSGWPLGPSGFGYGDGDDNTLLPVGTQSVYLRVVFTVRQLSDITDLYLDVDYDDGFVAYLNGTEVARENVQDPVSWNMELDGFREAVMYTGVRPERFELKSFIETALQPGRNVLAVEVHNENASSNDMSSNVFLHAGITVPDTLYGQVPDWFGDTVSFSEFNLPLMIIRTNGQKIPDEPRIVAEMGLIDHGTGVINRIDDPWNAYSGMISIEQRGESSIEFAKKSYSIELQNADGSNNNVSILGLPVENDFVLNGPFSDQTLVKNVLSYELFRRTGRWAPGTRFIELVLNDEYEGVYVLTEKLKRDENRVDIDKLTPEDVSPLDISGGYILRRDKKNKLLEEEWWTSPVKQPYHTTMWYEYYDPEYDELTPAQAQYIREWMKSFDGAMSGSGFADPENGYRKYIKTKSFIDMMFLNEISKGIDNYLFSTYFYKENDADGGQLVAGPPWDYNLGYGNLDYGDGWDAKETYGWCYPQGGRVYWFERLMEDPRYQNLTYCRWTSHRETIFSDEQVMAIIDSCVRVLGSAVDRNFARFPTLGNYVWPAVEPYPDTYEGEIDKLKSWLVGRLAWMDDQWLNQGSCDLQPPTDILLSNNVVPELQPPGTIIGVLSTLDPDSETHEYSLVAGEGDADNDQFTIFGSLLLSSSVFDYQLQNTLSLRISSTDENFESVEKVFEIQVSSLLSEQAPFDSGISFELYPNPTSDRVQIGTKPMNDPEIRVALIDVSGKILKVYEGPLHEINRDLSDDSGALDKGLYFVKMAVDGQIITKKFVKF